MSRVAAWVCPGEDAAHKLTGERFGRYDTPNAPVRRYKTTEERLVAEFALLNFAQGQTAVPGIKVGEHVLPISAALEATGKSGAIPSGSTKEILSHWAKAEPVLNAIADAFTGKSANGLQAVAKPLASVRLLAPILYPDAVFCAFANYTDHMKEMSGREPPDKTKVKPLFFLKLGAHAIIGPEETIKLPAYSQQVDWEAELAVVIGRPARNVTVANAMDHVAGYTILNDLSLRDQGNRSDWNVKTDFLSGKSFDTGAPMGPWIVPARQVPDIYNITLKQWVDRELMQDSSTSFMHFTIAEQVAYLAGKFTLRPGDVIATGSPSGNGRPRGIFLKPGQELTVEIEQIGRLHNPIVQGE
jgi:2-keto-4-pentenoate hydratase/2-oxohepta-3-ene-1,7-dioic acid hydratase in catechol pathway